MVWHNDNPDRNNLLSRRGTNIYPTGDQYTYKGGAEERGEVRRGTTKKPRFLRIRMFFFLLQSSKEFIVRTSSVPPCSPPQQTRNIQCAVKYFRLDFLFHPGKNEKRKISTTKRAFFHHPKCEKWPFRVAFSFRLGVNYGLRGETE